MAVIPAGYKQTEVGVIPNTWSVSRISKVMQLINGCAFKPQEWRKQGTPIIRIQNLNDPAAEFNCFQGAIDERNRVAAGDVLFAWSGTLGSSFGARIWSGPDGVLNQHIFKVIADERVLTKHYSYLIFKQVQDAIEKQSHGFKSSFVHVKKADIDNIQLPIPPLAEQRAIAAALSDVDALLAKLDQLIAKKHDLKQAAMQQLLTGQTRLPGFSGAWGVKRLRDVADLSPGINKPVSEMGAGVLYVTVQDLYNGTSIRVERLGRIRVSAAELQSQALIAGDIIFGKSSVKRDGIGYPSIFLGALEPVVCTGFAYRARAVPSHANARFLFYSLRWEPTRRWVIDNSQASALTNINKSIADAIPISLPSVEEQTAIATVLSDMDDEITALEARRDKTHVLKQGMMQELLTGRIRLVKPASAD